MMLMMEIVEMRFVLVRTLSDLWADASFTSFGASAASALMIVRCVLVRILSDLWADASFASFGA